MRYTFNHDTIGDWGNRYNGTYGILHANQEKGIAKSQVVLFSHVNENAVHFVNEAGLNLTAKLGADIQFEFVPLRTGWMISADGTVCFVRRIPARQWKRGICGDNTSVQMLMPNGTMGGTSISFLLVESILLGNQDYGASFHNWRMSKATSCALNRYFAIGKTYVYFMNKYVGDVQDGVITLHDTLCKQELQDCISRNFYPLKVAE